MGQLSSDIAMFLQYSGGKGHVQDDSCSSSAVTVYPVPDNDGGDSECEVWED